MDTNFKVTPKFFIFCFTKQVHSSSSAEHACTTFCRKKKNASVGGLIRIIHLTKNGCNGTQTWLPTLLPVHVVCCLFLVFVFYQLHASCPSGTDTAGRVSESGSMNYVQNISECPCYNHLVSLLHSLNFNKNA